MREITTFPVLRPLKTFKMFVMEVVNTTMIWELFVMVSGVYLAMFN